MKKLFMLTMAAVFSVVMVSAGYAQTTGTMEKKADSTEKTKEEKKAEKKAEKAEKKAAKDEAKAEKKAAKKAEKMEKKDAANPCAAKSAEKK